MRAKRKPVSRQLDGLNRPVSDWLSPVFYGRKLMKRWVGEALLLQMQLHLMEGAPFADRVAIAEVSGHLDAIVTLMREAVPHQPCWCEPSEHDCPLCGGKRWLSVKECQQASSPQPNLRSPGLCLGRGYASIHRSEKATCAE